MAVAGRREKIKSYSPRNSLRTPTGTKDRTQRKAWKRWPLALGGLLPLA